MPVWAAAVWLDLAAVTGAGDARVRPALHRGQTRRFGGGLVLLAQVASATGTFRLWHGIGSFRGDGDVIRRPDGGLTESGSRGQPAAAQAGAAGSTCGRAPRPGSAGPRARSAR